VTDTPRTDAAKGSDTKKDARRGAKYDGKPCGKCGHMLRYRSNRNCVNCLSEHGSANERRMIESRRRYAWRLAEAW